MKLQLNYKGGDCNRIKELVVKAYNDISAISKINWKI